MSATRTSAKQRLVRLGLGRGWVLPLALTVSLAVSAWLVYSLTQTYVHEQVEKRVRDTMMECRAFHYYVQQDLHPVYYRLMEEGRLPEGFYAPEMLSSTYITRTFQGHYNRQRREIGLPEIHYKMAAIDPRNEVNRATDAEAELLAWFAEDSTRTSYSAVVEEDGQHYLLYAQPFLRNERRCLRCHGDPADAPAGLAGTYQWTSGFDRKLGDISAVEIISSPIEGESNAAVVVLIAFLALSITASSMLYFNKRLRTLVARKTATLRESEERLSSVIQATNVGIWDWNLTTDKIAVNARWLETLGYTRDELTPITTDRWRELCHPDDLPFADDARNRHLSGQCEVYECEIRLRHKDGHWVWLYDRGRIMERDADGEPMRMSGTYCDISELKRLRDLECRAESLEAAERIAGQIAHDFNNLLAPLVAYPDLVREQLGADHPATPLVGTIEKSARRIAEINQQLLTLGRRGHYEVVTLDTNEIVGNCLDELLTDSPDIAVERDLAENLPPIRGGSAQLHRALFNILVNARDAVADGGTVAVSTESRFIAGVDRHGRPHPPGDYILTTIRDTGCGMSEEVRERVFDPFYTTKKTDNMRGSGLGLSIVDAVVRDHGGWVDLESAIGRGTAFYIYLPIAAQPEAAPESRPTEYPIAGGDESLLIVDDDPVQCEVASRLLGKLGYRTQSALSGEEAVAAARKQHFDLLLLDVVMPGMDGPDTYEAVLEINPQQKAILVSGYSESERVRRARELGAREFVRKPYTRERLASAVRTELDRPAEVLA